MFDLTIQWGNPASDLIALATQEPDFITVSSATLKGAQTDTRTFTVTATSGKVEVDVPFFISVAGEGQLLLRVRQTFTVRGTDLVPDSYMTDSDHTVAGQHPLINFPWIQNRSAGMATMFINTDFVDVTRIWRKKHLDGISGLATKLWAAKELNRFGCAFTVLACIGGFPRLWFVSVPAAATNEAAPSALVFFRPHTYAYHDPQHLATIIQSAHDTHNANLMLLRYLITPTCTEIGGIPAPPNGTKAPPPGFRTPSWTITSSQTNALKTIMS